MPACPLWLHASSPPLATLISMAHCCLLECQELLTTRFLADGSSMYHAITTCLWFAKVSEQHVQLLGTLAQQASLRVEGGLNIFTKRIQYHLPRAIIAKPTQCENRALRTAVAVLYETYLHDIQKLHTRESAAQVGHGLMH